MAWLVHPPWRIISISKTSDLTIDLQSSHKIPNAWEVNAHTTISLDHDLIDGRSKQLAILWMRTRSGAAREMLASVAQLHARSPTQNSRPRLSFLQQYRMYYHARLHKTPELNNRQW